MITMATEADERELMSQEDIFNLYLDDYLDTDFPEAAIAKHIYVYVCPFLLAIGSIANLAAAIVLFRMCEKVLSTCAYLFVVSLIDLVVLYSRCGNDWVFALTDGDMNVKVQAMVSSNSVCKIYPFVTDFALHLTTWLLVAMTIETTLVTIRPQRLSTIFTCERARAVILLLVVLLICINAHCFWTYALVPAERGPLEDEMLCTNAKQGNHNSEQFKLVIWPILNFLIEHFFPYFTIFACTVMIITVRVRRKDHMREIDTLWRGYALDGMAAKQFQCSIVLICLFYLILLFPKMIIDAFQYFVQPVGFALVTWTFEVDAKVGLAVALCSLLQYVFLSCKLFLYLATSPRFRHEFLHLCSSKCCRKRPHNNHHANKRTMRPKPLLPRETTAPPLPSQHNNHNHNLPRMECDGQLDHVNCVSKRLYAITSV